MAVTREQIGELVAKIFDRLEHENFKDMEIMDAVLVVELSDTEDSARVDADTDREAPATVVLLESTTDRTTVQEGILRFALILGHGAGPEDDE